MIGVLALQGDFAEHLAVLQTLGVDARAVRTPAEIEPCRGLVLPGGESTTIGKLLTTSGLRPVIIERGQVGTLGLYGTCAGAILLASAVTGKNAPEPLGLLDITVDRNAYGTQLQSFEDDLEIAGTGRIRTSFIRAPRITRVGEGVEVLATHGGYPVLVRSGNVIAGTFHPETHGENRIHRMLVEACERIERS